MMEESRGNNIMSDAAESGNAIAASSTDECNTISPSDVEFRRTDVPVYSRFVVLLEPIMLIYALYVGAMDPLSDQYIRSRISNNYNLTDGGLNKLDDDQDMCSNGSNRHANDDIDSQTTLWILYISVAALVPGLFSMILIGSYSDKGGRKIAIITPQIGAIVRCVSYFAVIYFDLSLYVLVFAAFIEGLSGGISMSYAAAFSYVTDITSHNRSLRMTILESCFGIGVVVSQIVLGYLITSLGYCYPFLLLTALLLLDIVVTACLLPETVTRDPDVRFWTFHHFRKAYHLYTRDNGTGRRWKLLLGLAIAFCTCAVTLGRYDVLIIYLLDAPFCWSSVLIGYFGALSMLISAPTSVLLTKLTQPKLSDSHLLLIATVSAAAYQTVVVFSTTTVFMFMGKCNNGLCIVNYINIHVLLFCLFCLLLINVLQPNVSIYP